MSALTGNTMPRINELWAFLSVDPEDGNEGVISITNMGMTMPLIAADEKRLRLLYPHAEQVAVATGIAVRLVKFTTREDLDTILPVPAPRTKQ